MRFIFVGSHFTPVVEKGEGSKRCCCDCRASASEPEEVAEEALTEEELQYIYNKLAAGDTSVLHEGDSAKPSSLLYLVEQKLREALKPEYQNLRVDTSDILIRLWAVIKESSKE